MQKNYLNTESQTKNNESHKRNGSINKPEERTAIAKAATRWQFIKSTLPGAVASVLGAGGMMIQRSTVMAEQPTDVNLKGVWQIPQAAIFNPTEQ